MNYEAERAMNQKRLRMEGEPGHGVVQGNGLPLNYIDNGHQIPYQPYAGAYNAHYPPPDAFAAYGAPPPGGYAPQNLSYAPPAHQNYPHHQTFAQQPPQPQLHMQSHMVGGYDLGGHKAWGVLAPLEAQKPLDAKHKPDIKLEPADMLKRPHPEHDIMGGDLDQPKIKIKTDIFKPDDLVNRPDVEKPRELIVQQPIDVTPKPTDLQSKVDVQPNVGDGKPVEKPPEAVKPEGISECGAVPPPPPPARADGALPPPTATPTPTPTATPIATATAPATLLQSPEEKKPFSSPEMAKQATTPKITTPGTEPKKRGRPKGSTNKPKPPGVTPTKLTPTIPGGPHPRGPPAGARPPAYVGRPRATGYQYAVRPFRKDFSGIQFRRRWSDDCLDSSHIPNEVYFGDVPVSMEVLFNYYDANAEREKLAAQAAHIAAQKAAAAKLAAAKLQARGLLTNEVTTVDSSSSDDSSGSDDESDESDEDAPLKKSTPKSKPAPKAPGSGTGKRGRPPVPPELRQPGITDMKRFCKAAGIRFDYKKLVEGCTKNKERVAKMMELLEAAGLEGKPTLEKCKALKQAKQDKRERDRASRRDAKTKHKDDDDETEKAETRRMTRGATGVKPRQRIVISSDEEDDTPAARRTLSKLRSSLNDHSDSD